MFLSVKANFKQWLQVLKNVNYVFFYLLDLFQFFMICT
jgi:hypothetical protein